MNRQIVTSNNVVLKEFLGVKFQVLAIGEHSMVTKMLYKKHNHVPDHSHPNEQSGYVISGKYRLTLQGATVELSAGDSYSIPKNEIHSIEILEEGEVVDTFTPPRPDYL